MPLFHRQGTLLEGGIRVPLLLRWPARLAAGTTSSQVGITMDLTASILAAAGVKPPGNSDLVRELRSLVAKWEADVDAESKERRPAR